MLPGLGRSPGEGIGYPRQYSWTSLGAQMVKNPPAMGEAWIPSLGWEDPMEEDVENPSSIPAWRIPWTEEPGGYSPGVRKESCTTGQPSAAQRRYVIQREAHRWLLLFLLLLLLLLLRRLSRVQLCAAAPKTYLCLLCAIIHSPHQSCETLLLDTFHIWDTKAQKCGVASQDYISSLCQSQDLNLGTLALKPLFLSKLYRPSY